jgi:Uma2 family endonuclease
MSQSVTRFATYDDLLALPDNVIGELISGQLVTSPRPSGGHAWASSMLNGSLVPRFGFGDDDGPGGWAILFEPELHLGVDVFVPDLAGWRRERMPRVPKEATIELAPDWICEILSPSTARTDRVVKMPAYAEHGVPHLWLIDPIAETLEVYQLESARWVLLGSHGGDSVVRAVPFDAMELRLDRLWT